MQINTVHASANRSVLFGLSVALPAKTSLSAMFKSVIHQVICATCAILLTPTVLAQSIFPDKNLEAAVRKEVFEKRNNQDPITAEDVKRISQVEASKAGIASLEGLQHCESLMRIDLPENEITDLTPLASLKRLQSVNLANNKIESIEPLKEHKNIQYLKLSNNAVTDLTPVTSMANMRALYVEGNKITSLEPISGLSKITSLYAGGNPIENYSPIGNLPWLSSLDLRHANIMDLHFLMPLKQVRVLNLSHNKVQDLTTLIEMCKADVDDGRRFAPYLRVYVEGNNLPDDVRSEQFKALRDMGVRVFDGSPTESNAGS